MERVCDVIDLADSSPEASPVRALKALAPATETLDLCDDCDEEHAQATGLYALDDDAWLLCDETKAACKQAVFDLTADDVASPPARKRKSSCAASEDDDFEREMARVEEQDEEQDEIERPRKGTRLSPTEKAARAARRKEERAKAKAAKEAVKAAEMSAYAEARRVDVELRCSASFRRSFAPTVTLLEGRGYRFAEAAVDELAGWPTLEWLAIRGSSPVSTNHRLVVMDLTGRATGSIREPLDMLAAAVGRVQGKTTVALLGPERERFFGDIARLEDAVGAVRCLIPPKQGRDPDAKITAKLTELIQSHSNAIVALAKDGAPAVAPSSDLFSGLDTKDLAFWEGPKPKTNAKAWPAFLRAILPANAADAVAKAFPTYARLVQALEVTGIDAIQNLTMRTASGQRIGPALANRLLTTFTSRDPAVVPRPAP